MVKSSRLSGFFKLGIEERAALLRQEAGLSADDAAAFTEGGLAVEQADHMAENVVGLYALPLGVATNFVINGHDVLVPMAIEEPSVIAGASLAARLVRDGGGFVASADAPLMIGQIQVLDLSDLQAARSRLLKARERLLALANEQDPVMVKLGGGARDVEVRVIDSSPAGPMLVVHLIYDARDAMGANAVNTALEAIAPTVAEISGGRTLLRILTNLADRRLARASCRVPAASLTVGSFEGKQVAQGIVEAWALAATDPYRAATHNKGIMNGIDAVVLATGNDWRAIEAGAHAYAARSGSYRSLSTWGLDSAGDLIGSLELPMAVGIVGGATRVHPTARAALKLIGVKTAAELAAIIAAVGLAQNLAALRALVSEGIQKGHMKLHARQVAMAAGAEGEEIDPVVQRMLAAGAVRVDRAEEILKQLRTKREAK
ncbi:MAG TPA: hydroxymethylglutaryl-CoA reductase, degradative [Anaerolineae bacterium]|nr:hydroxymethylglutaryl-CoA reductase, degradative [Anaerolineae bacterium]HNT04679.1 hydroxymethylglutaryl-CoA reductase, degradative [Anaerolineae bacterium]